MTSQQPAAGWYPDPSGGPGQRYWDGQQWVASTPVQTAQPAAGWYPDPSGGPGQRYWDGQQWVASPPVQSAPAAMGRRGLKRMAGRMARRAGINEQGQAVAFSYSSGWAALLFGVGEELVSDIPFLPLLLTIISFHWHRIILVTDQRAYLFQARLFHQPGAVLGTYPLGPGSMTRVRGKLTFVDGQVAYHVPVFAWRMKAIAQAAGAE
jgi:hypothetical protein